MSRHRPVAETRAALVQAALTVVAREGVSGATTRAVAAEAGIPLASVHYAFASRDELLGEVVRYAVSEEYRSLGPAASNSIFADASELFAPAPDGGRPAVVDVAVFGLGRYLEGLKRNPDREKAMLVLTFWALSTPQTEGLARDQYERYAQFGTEVLETVAEASGVRWSLPLPDMARLLIALLDGITVAWLVTRDDAQAEMLAAAAAHTIAAHALPVADAATDSATNPVADPARDPAAAPAPEETPV